MMSKESITRNRLKLIRDASRIYFADKDKHDPFVAEQRREVAEDIRYFHKKWIDTING